MSENLEQKPAAAAKPFSARAKRYFLGFLYILYVLVFFELALKYVDEMAWTFAEISHNPVLWLVVILLHLFGTGLILGAPRIWAKWDRSTSNKQQARALLVGAAKGLGTGVLVMGLTLAIVFSIAMLGRGWRPWSLLH
jgi:hypothetical protein